MLTVSACGTAADPQPSAAEPEQAVPAEPTATTAVPATTATTAVPATTAAAGLELRAEVESGVAALLSVDRPAGVTDDQVACVAEASAAGLDQDRLEPVLAALNGPSDSIFPVGLVSDLERDRILDGVVECLPWSQVVLSSMLASGEVPPAVLECAQAATTDIDTDRLTADIALFGGDLIAVFNLLIPPDCVPGVDTKVPGLDDQPTSAAGRLTAAQLVAAGVSPESAACVAAQVDAINETLPQGADIDEQAEQAMVAAMFGCLTPEEVALLSGPDG